MSGTTKSFACDTCSSKSSTCSPESCDTIANAAKNEQELKIKNNLTRIKNRIAIVSGKGGVGKSTVAAGIALNLAKKGYKVGVLDADVSGPNMPHLLGVESRHMEGDRNGLLPIEAAYHIKVASVEFLLEASDSPMVWRGPMRSSLINQFLSDVRWGDLDFLLIDLPPGTGDEPLSIMQTIPLTGLVVVSTPSNLSLLDVSKIINMAKMLKVGIIGVVENMAYFECPDCHKKVFPFGENTVKLMSDKYGLMMLGSISMDPANGGRDVITMDEGSSIVRSTGEITDIILKMI